MLNTNWIEVEVIELLVDSAASLGIGMCGSKSIGTVVRQIHAGGAAELDGRLRLGDHIVCVQDFNVRGFGPDQVATVLRHTISTKLLATALNPEADALEEDRESLLHNSTYDSSPEKREHSESIEGGKVLPSVAVRFIVARAALGDANELSEIYMEQQRRFAEQQVLSALSIIPTERLDEYLEAMLNTPLQVLSMTEENQSLDDLVQSTTERPSSDQVELLWDGDPLRNAIMVNQKAEGHLASKAKDESTSEEEPVSTAYIPIEKSDTSNTPQLNCYDELVSSLQCPASPQLARDDAEDRKEHIYSTIQVDKTLSLDEDEYDEYIVKLERQIDEGLGLTVVGYVYQDPLQTDGDCMSGIFIQKLVENSVAEKCGLIQKNDQIVQVNGESILGLDNLKAVSILKQANSPVILKLHRHKRGFLYEQLCRSVSKYDQKLNTIAGPCNSLPYTLTMHPRQTYSQSNGYNLKPNFIESPMILELTDCLECPSTCNQIKSTVKTPVLHSEEDVQSLVEHKSFVNYFRTKRSSTDDTTGERSSRRVGEIRRETLPSLSNFLELNSEEEVDFCKPVPACVKDFVDNHVSPCATKERNSKVTPRRLTDPSLVYAGEVTPELEELMRNVWQPLIGPDCDVIVLHIKKPKSATSLGISVEGVDWVRESGSFPVANGELNEPVLVEPRHFVQSIVPDGLLGSLNIIQPGDELLQVNGRRLRGMSRSGTVRCLRNLPSHIELVLARSRHPNSHLLAPDELALLSANADEPPLEVLASEVNSVDTTYSNLQLPSNSFTVSHPMPGEPLFTVSPRTVEKRVSEWVRRSVVDIPDNSSVTASHDLNRSRSLKVESSYMKPLGASPYPPDSDATVNERRSYLESYRHHSPYKRLTDSSGLATMPRPRSGTFRVQDPRYRAKRPVWSSVPLLVQLTKSDRGFGFSLSEYEELPVSETESRRRHISLSLGRRHSNRRSPFSSPSKVQRSATLPRTMDHSSTGRKASSFSSSRKGYILLVDGVVPNGVAHQDGRISIGDRLLFINDRNLSKASLHEAVRALKSAPNGPCLLGISKMHLVPNVVEEPDSTYGPYVPIGDPEVNTTSVGYEPLYVNTGEHAVDDGQAPTFPVECSNDHPLNFHVLPEDYQQPDVHGPYLDVPPVDRSQEQFTKIVLLSAPIGVKLDALAAKGQDGCRIVQIFDGGAVRRSNALKPNDYITELDGLTMRHVTNLEAFQRLRQSSNRDGTVDVTYIPAEVITAHRLKHIGMKKTVPVGFVLDTERNGQAESYAEPFGFIEQVMLIRNASETCWGLNLGGEECLPALPVNVKSHLSNPTCVQSIKPDSPAERCGCLQPGDIILKVADTDVVQAGPAHVCQLLQDLLNKDVMQLSLGVRFSTVAPPPEEVNSKTTTVAEVERRTSLANQAHLGAHRDEQAGKCPNELYREDSPSSFSQIEAPEPLSEMDSRDELNVLSRSIESPVHRINHAVNGDQHGDSGAGDDIVPLSSLACPVLSDDSIVNDTTANNKSPDQPIVNGNVFNSFRDGAGFPPPPPLPPPRRFSKENTPFSVDDSISNLPIVTEDPISLYERDEPVGDQVLSINIEIPWPMVNASGDSPSPKFESLGIHLVGSSNPNLNATYVAGLTPGSIAAQNSQLQIGDEIVQVGQNSVVDLGRLMVGRCITRAVYQSVKRAATEQDLTVPRIFLVIRRNPNNLQSMASVTSSAHQTPEHSLELPNGPSSISHGREQPDGRTPGSSQLATGDDSEALLSAASTIPLSTSVNQLPVPHDLLAKLYTVLEESPDLYNIFDTEIQRNSNGYGIFIVNYGPQDKPGVFVSDLAPNGAAAQHGELCPNDRILAVNGQIQTDYDSTLSLMKQSTTRVRLTIAREKPIKQAVAGDVTKPVATSSPAPSAALANAPSTQPPIVPGKETLIELNRHHGSSWGFSVVGGKDTMLGGILVHAVHDNGIVAEDGRIAVGDRLLAVNGVDLRNVDHETGKKIIRNAGDSLRLLVYRDPPMRLDETDQPQEFEVTISRKPGENLGLSLFGRSPYSTGTAIAAVVPGTPAAQCGMLSPGDVILEINGLDYRLAQYQEVASALKAASGNVRLKVQREPPSTHPTHPPHVPYKRLKLYVVVLRRSEQDSTRAIGFQQNLLGSSNLESSFGLFIRQASDEEVLDAGGNLIVEDIQPGSPAAMSIMIQPGDRLLTVDREPVDWLRPDDVCTLLSSLTECTLELGRLPVAPYPVDPGLSTACFLQDEEPPYPISLELPAILDAEMPVIEPPPGVRTMDTLEEEAPRASAPPIGLADSKLPNGTQLSSSSSNISSTNEDDERIAERAATGFQVRQVYLPPALPGVKLGIRLAKARGISGPVIVRITPNSVAAQTVLRVGDRILGLDDKLLLLSDSDTTPRKLLARINETWLARGSSLENPVCLTVIGVSDRHTQNSDSSSNSEQAPIVSTSKDPIPLKKPPPDSSVLPNGLRQNPPSSHSHPALRGLILYDSEEADRGRNPTIHGVTRRTSLS